MTLKRLLPLILLLTGLMAGPSCGAGAKVNASSGFTGVKVEASMLVQADAQTLWATLTDYNKLATFIPDMVSSRVISPPGAPKKVEQVADAGLFAFVMPDHVVLLMEESPNQLIRFRSVSGKVLSMNGEWRIMGDAAPVTLVYRSHVVPMAPLSPLVSNYFVEDEVKKRFEAVGLEAERRMKSGGSTNRFNPWLYR
jgi:ribosome-associated toxin RatA of RatAB toxin-antitoxin module